MPQRFRIPEPPITKDTEVNRWFRRVTEALNQLPDYSIMSTSAGPESNATAAAGALGIDVGTSSAGTFWIKLNAGEVTAAGTIDHTRGWASLDPAYAILETSNLAGEQNGLNISFTTFTQWNGFGPNINALPSALDNLITINSTGTYFVQFGSSFTADASADYTFELSKNGSGLGNVHGFRRTVASGGGNDYVSGTVGSVITCAADDEVSVHVKSSVTNTGLSPYSAQLVVNRLS